MGCPAVTVPVLSSTTAVSFPAWSYPSETHWHAGLLQGPGFPSLPVHPTQLYESFGELVLFALLALVVRPNKRFHGQVLATWLMGYAVLRTVVELFRGDVERGVVAGLGVGQWTSMVVFAAGVVVWVIGHRQGARVRGARTVLAT